MKIKSGCVNRRKDGTRHAQDV